MGVETFGQPDSGLSGDESGRVEDVTKAEEAARAGDSARSFAAESREKLNDPDRTPRSKREHGFEGAAQVLDKLAEQREERADLEYDTEKSMEGMSDEEVEAARDKMFVDEVAARGKWQEAREVAGRADAKMLVPERELVGERPTKSEVAVLEEEAEKAKTAYFQLNSQRTAIEVVLQKRWRKSEKK